jgi:hypothetical protein
MRIILALVFSLFLWPSLAFGVKADNYPYATVEASPEEQRLYNLPLMSHEPVMVKDLAKFSGLSAEQSEQVVRAARISPDGSGDTFLVYAILMAETDDHFKTKMADRHGLLKVSESFLKKAAYAKDIAACGVYSAEDLNDLRGNVCAAKKIIYRLIPKHGGKDYNAVAKEYGGSGRKEYDEYVGEYYKHFLDVQKKWLLDTVKKTKK